jgi:small multidrug resistance pump
LIAAALLALAIAIETGAVLAIRASAGFSRPLPAVAALVGLGLAAFLLSQVLRSMPISVAYAIWTAAGTAIFAAIGMIAFGEPSSALRIGSLALIVVGVVGLHFSGSH